MSNMQFFTYLLVLAGSTYLIRVIPFVALKEKINNRFVRSFLAYIPYAVLTAMTIPAIFYATNWWLSAAAGLVVAVFFALRGKSLTVVAIASCIAVYVVEFFHSIEMQIRVCHTHMLLKQFFKQSFRSPKYIVRRNDCFQSDCRNSLFLIFRKELIDLR